MVSSCRRVRKPILEVVDVSLLQWFSNIRSTQPNFPISGDMLLKKAQEFADLSNQDKPVTTSWVNRWKAHHQVS